MSIPVHVDKASFARTLKLCALVLPSGLINKIKKELLSFVFQRPQFRCIYPSEASQNFKLLLLKESEIEVGLSPEVRAVMDSHKVGATTYEISLTYEDLTY